MHTLQKSKQSKETERILKEKGFPFSFGTLNTSSTLGFPCFSLAPTSKPNNLQKFNQQTEGELEANWSQKNRVFFYDYKPSISLLKVIPELYTYIYLHQRYSLHSNLCKKFQSHEELKQKGK
ncbi:hypothetical protein V6Z11_D06G145900 [Gossypium hirsutum]